MDKSLLSSASKFNSTNILILLYFFLGGILFDLSSYLIEFIQIKQITPLFEHFINYSFSNLIGFLLSLLFLVIIKPQYTLYFFIAASLTSIGFINIVIDGIGIITVVWHLAFGCISAILLYFSNYFHVTTDIYNRLLDTNYKRDINKLILLKEEIWMLLKIVIQFTLTFGVLTGVCMTILFKDEYTSLDKKAVSIEMVVGFAICILSLYIWIFAPSLKKIDNIRAVIRM